MLLFTYNDYLDCLSNRKIQKAIYLENKKSKIEQMIKPRESSEIQFKRDELIDEFIEDLLNREEEIAYFINDFFKMCPWKISKEVIERCNMKDENKSMVYKHKEKEVYFLIDLQKEPNYHIAYRILMECTNLVNKWKKIHPYYKHLPVIVPIVIYIGRREWNNKQNINIKYTSFEANCINLSYNFIDLCRCNPTKLLKNKSLISNAIILKMLVSDEIKQKTIDKLNL